MVKVYHSVNLEIRSIFDREDETGVLHRWMKEKPEAFLATMAHYYVATVDTNELDTAYSETNHIDWEWWKNPTILHTDLSNSKRSTSVGDLLEKEDGTLWVVMSCGFEKLILENA